MSALEVAVIGLGYVGAVEAAVLAAGGARVVGVDRRASVVEALDAGRAPIAEPDLEERLARAKASGMLRATTNLAEAIEGTRGALLCVGTPRDTDGSLDTSQLEGALREVASAVPPGTRYEIVVRSTVPPGFHASARALLNEIARERGVELGLALNPEFLREGAAVRDREQPELVVYATEDEATARFVEAVWAGHEARIARTTPEVSEILKLVCNGWHALKVSFANEVARLARPMGADPFEVMELLCRDTRLNTSAAYLRPGMPFGGACLVKDVAALQSFAAARGVDAPLMRSVLPSNRAHLDDLVAEVMKHAPKRVAVIGIGFKPGAADVRDSAPVELVRVLLDLGLEVTVADAAVLDARVPPLGIDALRAALGDPRARAVESVSAAAAGADVVVVGHPAEADRRALVALRPVPACVLDASGELSRALSEADRDSLAPVVVLRAASR